MYRAPYDDSDEPDSELPENIELEARAWRPRCPDENPQRIRHPLGFRERNVGELELRVALGGDDSGVCQVVVDEREDEIYVRVLIHDLDKHADDRDRSREYTDWPVRAWLERPLGDRAVIDVDLDEELPLYKPRYLNNIPQADHGYYPANRRRRSPGQPKSAPIARVKHHGR